MDIENLLNTAIAASIEAGKAILEVYEANENEVAYKEDDSPLTQADLRANDILVKRLSNTGIPIISEEIKNAVFSEREDWESCWIIDPLDGTKEFVKRNGSFTVNVALLHQKKLVMGVIFVPVTSSLYFTSPDMNTAYQLHYQNSTIEFTKLKESAAALSPSKNSGTLKIVGSKSHMNDATKRFIDDLSAKDERAVEIHTIGSSLKFCLVASGACEIYPRFGPTMEWDTAAGQAICEAVGLSVVHAHTDEPLEYNKANLYNPHFIVK